MSKFTPGPWVLEVDGYERKITVGDRLMALMCDTQYYPWCPNSDADWRLIAAAPEMYGALREAATVLGLNGAIETQDRIRAILAKVDA